MRVEQSKQIGRTWSKSLKCNSTQPQSLNCASSNQALPFSPSVTHKYDNSIFAMKSHEQAGHVAYLAPLAHVWGISSRWCNHSVTCLLCVDVNHRCIRRKILCPQNIQGVNNIEWRHSWAYPVTVMILHSLLAVMTRLRWGRNCILASRTTAVRRSMVNPYCEAVVETHHGAACDIAAWGDRWKNPHTSTYTSSIVTISQPPIQFLPLSKPHPFLFALSCVTVTIKELLNGGFYLLQSLSCSQYVLYT